MYMLQTREERTQREQTYLDYWQSKRYAFNKCATYIWFLSHRCC